MLTLVTLPTPSLRDPSVAVTNDSLQSPDMQRLIDEMFPTMHAARGIGLAAPQIGHNIRVFTVGKEALENFSMISGSIIPNQDLALVNAQWEKTTRRFTWETEGCLSVKGKIGSVKRYRDIRVIAQVRDGQRVEFLAREYFARVIQHEVDHLNGVLFVDKARQIRETP
jgi:peptide deformylase